TGKTRPSKSSNRATAVGDEADDQSDHAADDGEYRRACVSVVKHRATADRNLDPAARRLSCRDHRTAVLVAVHLHRQAADIDVDRLRRGSPSGDAADDQANDEEDDLHRLYAASAASFLAFSTAA